MEYPSTFSTSSDGGNIGRFSWKNTITTTGHSCFGHSWWCWLSWNPTAKAQLERGLYEASNYIFANGPSLEELEADPIEIEEVIAGDA